MCMMNWLVDGGFGFDVARDTARRDCDCSQCRSARGECADSDGPCGSIYPSESAWAFEQPESVDQGDRCARSLDVFRGVFADNRAIGLVCQGTGR